MAFTEHSARSPVPARHLAVVVTVLQSNHAPKGQTLSQGMTLRRAGSDDLKLYRELYDRVGALPWLWRARLLETDAHIQARLSDPNNEIWLLYCKDAPLGLLELSCAPAEIIYLGIENSLRGQGVGSALVDFARNRLKGRPLMLETCTADDPRALGFYISQGFEIKQQFVEIFEDPRLMGLLPKHAAPHIPLAVE